MSKDVGAKLEKTIREASSLPLELSCNKEEGKERFPKGLDPAEVIREFIPIIRRIAGALAARNPSSLDAEDLTSAGMIGLLAALARYDPTREIKFRTYAEYRIRGMMLDELRAMDWVPRSVRSRNDQIQQLRAEFMRKEGRQPARDEIAKALGLTQDEFEATSQREGHLLSLDEPVGDNEETYTLRDVLPDMDQPDPFSTCFLTEVSRAVESALAGLPERQQEIMRQYYYSGLTMKEIGKSIGLTESGVCRVHADAISRLRAELQNIQETAENRDSDTHSNE